MIMYRVLISPINQVRKSWCETWAPVGIRFYQEMLISCQNPNDDQFDKPLSITTDKLP